MRFIETANDRVGPPGELVPTAHGGVPWNRSNRGPGHATEKSPR